MEGIVDDRFYWFNLYESFIDAVHELPCTYVTGGCYPGWSLGLKTLANGVERGGDFLYANRIKTVVFVTRPRLQGRIPGSCLLQAVEEVFIASSIRTINGGRAFVQTCHH